jgi:uncharacterized membrane protein YbhN (UPF0104 family)
VNRSRKGWLKGLAGLALLAAVAYLADPAALLLRLREADGRWLLLGLVAAFASNVVSAWRWHALAQWLGLPMRWMDALRWYFQAIGLNALLPGAVVGGDVYRAVAAFGMLQAPAAPMPAAKAVASLSVLLDRLSGVWMLCALGALGAAASAPALAPVLHVRPFFVLVVAVLGALLLLAFPWVLLLWLRAKRPNTTSAWLAPLTQAAARPDAGRQWLLQALSSGMVQVLSATALALGGLALDVHLPASAWAFAMAPIFLLAALPVSIGGWGTREAASIAALAPFGVPAAAAMGVALVYGGYALVQGAVGALAFGMPGRSARQRG